MEKLPFDLMDLVPHEVTFTTSGIDKPLTLCKWSLRVRNWAKQKYGPQNLEKIFAEQRIDEIAEIAWFMLKEKDLFQNEMNNFLDAVSSMKDQVNLIKALLGAIGIGEPEIEKIDEALKSKNEKGEPPKGNAKSPKTKIGAKSSTP